MRISSSTIGMDSARSYASATKKTASFTRQTYAGILEKREGSLTFQGMLLGGSEEETRTGTDSKEEAMLDLRSRFKVPNITKVTVGDKLETLDRIRQQCIRFLLQLFTKGRKGTKWEEEDVETGSISDSGEQTVSNAGISTTVLSAQISETYMESEATSFQTTGCVMTADGRKIEFNLEMEMSRSFQATYEQSYETMYRHVDMCDPLVINLDNNIASVSDQKFFFDIDADGVLDEISELNAGSGYLALDKNGDGRIGDGSELFGPKSGDGFADLAQYDEDGNGWIDEDDAVWDKLLIWTKDENGKDQLYHISEKGIGAIALQHQSTEFSLNSMQDNRTNGMIRSSGIFLYENGNVGTVQHVDMAR